ncbi:MAG: hypothetical protein ACHQWU_11210 [Gemmatimonadales bacterium]
MSPWLIALVAGLVVAFVQYGSDALRGGWSIRLGAILRIAAIVVVVALLLDAPATRAARVPVWAALDGSLSMARGGTTLWRAALDSVRRAGAESVFVFGDSVRRGDIATSPRDQASRLRPAIDRALGAGHPLTVITDGEVDDPEAATTLPGGSRVIVLAHAARRDAAVASLDAPRAVVSGDSADVRVSIAAASAGARAGRIDLAFGDRSLGSVALDSLGPYAERSYDFKAKLDGPAGPSLLRAVVRSADDAEPRNDTVAVSVDLSRAASAVFASTSPDFDARYALAVLRGSLGIPTRGYYRVSP